MLVTCLSCGNACSPTIALCPRCKGPLKRPPRNLHVLKRAPTFRGKMKTGLGVVGAFLLALLVRGAIKTTVKGAVRYATSPSEVSPSHPTSPSPSKPRVLDDFYKVLTVHGNEDFQIRFDAD